jgi:anti-sigma B factor antagonist
VRRCPVCDSAHVVVLVSRSRRAFCSECGAQWAQNGSDQRNVRRNPTLTEATGGAAIRGVSLSIELFMDGGGIRLAGEIDMENAHRLEAALSPLVARGGQVLVECSALTFMDSSGFGVLIRAAQRLGRRGRLVLLSPGDLIARTLTLMGVEQVPNLEVRDRSATDHVPSQRLGPGAAHRFEPASLSSARSRRAYARTRRKVQELAAANESLRADRTELPRDRGGR